METNILQEISERQNKIFSEQFAFENFVKSHEKELIAKFREQFPDVELFSGKIHINNCHISINGMQYWFSEGKWNKR